jgi:nitrate/TMAO reductase-like tetraheme cytochrome c subunit
MHRRSAILITAGAAALFMLALAALLSNANAAPSFQQNPTPDPRLSLSDEYCLGCHRQPDQTYPLGNGELLDLYVPPELHQQSVHGQMGYACVQCHREVGEYPHPPFEAAGRRDATLKLNEVTCKNCHLHQYEQSMDGVHTAARAAGKLEAATCSDCHTAHEVRRLNDPQTRTLLPDAKLWIPERCALCHNAIYQEYKNSVHGAALTDGNPDVPTCIDCHGVHDIQNPTTNRFRLNSPLMCAECHTDAEIMDQYGISTNVLDTYVADFHGTTVAIFNQESPDAEVNKAVCYDCHGIHNIGLTDDPHTGLQMQQNLLVSCQKCHPDATPEFTAAWMSHFTPSPDKYALVYYVDLFYKLFIPLTLGGMALLVVLDASRATLNRYRASVRSKGERAQAEQAAHMPPEEAAPQAESETAPQALDEAELSPPVGETSPEEPDTNPAQANDSEAQHG